MRNNSKEHQHDDHGSHDHSGHHEMMIKDFRKRFWVLTFAGALEAKSEHPLAMGIMDKIKQEDIKIPKAENFNSITGKGIEANVDKEKVMVVSPRYIEEKNIEIPDKAFKTEDECKRFLISHAFNRGHIYGILKSNLIKSFESW